MLSIVVFIIFIIAMTYILLSNKNTTVPISPNMINDETKKTINSNKVIVTFKGDEYDITDFIRKHPGGKQVLLDNNGNDIEKLMLENEHSIHAYKTLEKYKIKK